jgi:hypothetical protein
MLVPEVKELTIVRMLQKCHSKRNFLKVMEMTVFRGHKVNSGLADH